MSVQNAVINGQSKFSVISTFSGCGGSSLGYQLAGGKVLLAVEFDDHAVECYRLNFPDTKIFHGDIAKLSVENTLKMTDLKSGELDIFDGSPPCQGFSTAGKRDLQDTRNQLFVEYCRLLRGLKPKVFVMENVSGMVKGKMKLIFYEIIRELRACGYKTKAMLLNAKYFNVPQSRERLIFVGVRNDFGFEPHFPKPNNHPIAVKNVLPNKTTEYAPILKDKYGKLWPKIPPGKSAAYVIGKGFNSCVKLNPNKPSPTLPKLNQGNGFATIAHWKEPRSLTINEAKIIASFPSWFELTGKYQEQWARIGNSVPPNFMRAIAECIYDNILLKTR